MLISFSIEIVIRIMFNDVVTETKFSSWGAKQLECDVSTLIDVFSTYTNRPRTHFKVGLVWNTIYY